MVTSFRYSFKWSSDYFLTCSGLLVCFSCQPLTHNFLLPYVSSGISRHSDTPSLLVHHLAASQFFQTFLTTFTQPLRTAPPSAPSPQIAPSFHQPQRPVSSVSAESSAATTTTSVWTPWGDLSGCCCSGQTPPRSQILPEETKRARLSDKT